VKKTLGHRIRERREELDLSLREFAKQLMCSPPFISDIEHGRRFPSEDTLHKMAKLLNLGVDELKALDPRAPIEEIRQWTERDPSFAFAFRSLVNARPSSEDILKFAKRRAAASKGTPDEDR